MARITAARGVPFVTAATAVRDAFNVLGARTIGLVSPYPQDLTDAAVSYWENRDFQVGRVLSSPLEDGTFHPIHAMTGEGAHQALRALDPRGLDAIAMLGTGMPTPLPILRTPFHAGVPVMSCMLPLAWRPVCAVDGVPPDWEGLLAWVRAEGWGRRYLARMARRENGGRLT